MHLHPHEIVLDEQCRSDEMEYLEPLLPHIHSITLENYKGTSKIDSIIGGNEAAAHIEDNIEPSSKKEINGTSDKEDNEGTESGKSKNVDIAGEKITAACDVNLSLAASSMEVEVDPFIEEENEVANAEEYDEPSSKKEINETSDKEDNERTESGKSKDVDIAGEKITAACDVN